MAALSKKQWGIVALAVVAGVAGFLLVSGGGYEPGEVGDTGDAYTEADERFHVEADSTISRTHEFEVPRGTAAMTVARALSFPDRGVFKLFDEDGDKRGEVSPQAPSMMEPTGSVVVHGPDPGTWRMTVECEAGCEYTLGVYYDDVLDPPEVDFRDDVEDSDAVVHVSHGQGVSREETFEVPENTGALDFSFSFYAADGGEFEVQDPSGDEVTRWSWDAEWLNRQTRYVPVQDPQAGTWTVAYECDVGCEAAWGFSFPGAQG